jgi:hypothetical protein
MMEADTSLEEETLVMEPEVAPIHVSFVSEDRCLVARDAMFPDYRTSHPEEGNF